MLVQGSSEDRERAEALLHQIADVFDDGPPPSSADVARATEEIDREGATALRDALSGRSWSAVPEAWIRKHWSSTCYLTPEAFRYYLPALLASGLRDVVASRDHVRSIVHVLTPSMHAIYWEGGDGEHEERVAALTAPEYDVVCAFLALVQLELYPFAAAEAMRWGWSVRETEHHAGMRAHYERMFGWEWPVHEDAEVAGLAARIEQVFADVPYPGDDRLCGSNLGDEPAGYALEFRGRDWRTLHPEFLSRNYAAPSFFTPEGFRCFFPAYLLADLHAGDNEYDPLYGLTGRIAQPSHGFHEHARERGDGFTPAEVEVLIEYLRHRRRTEWYEEDKQAIDRALEAYWLRRLG